MQLFLTEDQLDCLQELINISYGRATAGIATILDAFAKMRVPSVKMLTREELMNEITLACEKDGECFLSIQLFTGNFDGESVFLIDSKSANNLVEHLNEPNDHDSLRDTVMELTNMVTSSLISELTKKLKTDVYFNEPFIEQVDVSTIRNVPIKSEYEHIILINTVMEFEEQDIHGEVFILMHEKSFDWMKNALDQALSEYF